MEESNKNKWIIWTAFLLPIIFIVVVILINYIPSTKVNTKYNFVYVLCDEFGYYDCNNYISRAYVVEDQKLIKKQIPPDLDLNFNNIKDVDENIKTRIFVYDSSNGENQELSFEEASKLKISDKKTSPDGVWVSGDRDYNDFLFFGGRSEYNVYLVNSDGRKKIELPIDRKDYYGYESMNFIGWIIKD